MSYRYSRIAWWQCAVVAVVCQTVLPALAADELAVTPAQLTALGVTLQKLGAGSGTEGPTYPARVMLPPRQQQVVSAPLAGVIEQLLVSETDEMLALH